MPVSGVSASGSARKTGQDSAHLGPQSSLAGRHAGLRSSSATGGCPLRPHPCASRHPGRRTARRGSAEWEVEQGPLPLGTALCKSLREEEGEPFKLGGNANAERSPGTSTFPHTLSLPVPHSHHPSTPHTPILQVVRPEAASGNEVALRPISRPDLEPRDEGRGEDLTRT